MEMFVAVLGFLLTVAFLVTISFSVQRTLARRGAASALHKAQHWHERNTGVLLGLILLAIAYTSLLRHMHTLTGTRMLDGSIGVAISLYICAHPAANAVNMLFLGRDTVRQMSEWCVVGWLALNFLVLLAGWIVVFVAIRQLLGRPICKESEAAG